MRVRLTQIDGKLPNLALMKLAHWHKHRGDYVWFTRRIDRHKLEEMREPMFPYWERTLAQFQRYVIARYFTVSPALPFEQFTDRAQAPTHSDQYAFAL
jgi:hypothetical protein